MSDYQFETDREENALQTLGDGGHLEEEFGLKFDEVGGTNKRPCNFDYATMRRIHANILLA